MNRQEAITILKRCELNPCVAEDRQAAAIGIQSIQKIEAIKMMLKMESCTPLTIKKIAEVIEYDE